MPETHNLKQYLTSIGTAQRPVNVWGHGAILTLSLMFGLAIATVDLYCTTCETTPGSIVFQIILILAAGVGPTISLFALMQYYRHRNH